MDILFKPTRPVENKDIKLQSQNVASISGCEKYPELTLTLERPVESKAWCVRCRDRSLPKDPTKVDIDNEPEILFTSFLSRCGFTTIPHFRRLYIKTLIKSKLDKILDYSSYEIPDTIVEYILKFIDMTNRI